MTQVDCSGRRFENVPDKLPVFASYLDLSRNQIKEIGSDSFNKGLDQLKQLNLRRNGLNVLRGRPFSRLATLEHLDLRGNTLSSIPQNVFSDLKNLKTLILSWNVLAELHPTSFLGLGHLNELHLDNNKISTLPNGIFNEVTQMTVINLDRNKLSCFPLTVFKPLVKIKEISLHGNRFYKNCTSFDLRHFTALEKLRLSRCTIRDTMLEHFKFAQTLTLQDLDLGDNYLTYPDAKRFGNVTTLSLNKNFISADTLAKLCQDLRNSKVKSLHLQDQYRFPHGSWQITNTTFKGLQETSLDKLDISSNFIPVPPPGVFQWLQHVTTLNITDCELCCLSNRSFKGLDHLITLILTQNNLSNITKVSQSIAHLRRLQFLHLNVNKFFDEIPADIFAVVPSLLVLDLSENSFTSIQRKSFNSLPNLQYLDLSYNAIQHLGSGAFSFLISLQTLYLKGNDFGRVDQFSVSPHPFKGLIHLKQLSVSVYHPEFLYLKDIPSLEYLHISSPPSSMKSSSPKNINSVVFDFFSLQKANLSRLEIIHIEEADIKTTPFFLWYILLNDGDDKGLNDAKLNNVPWNNMKTLRLYSSTWKETKQELIFLLKLFPNLEVLSLKAFNVLQYMDVIPSTVTRLKSLDISSNQITKINTNVLKSLPNLKTLDIHQNPFSCSKCEMKSLVQWLENDKMVSLSEVPTCATPQEMDGVSLLTLEFGWECNLGFMVSVPTTCIVVVLIVALAVGIRFRWHIRYLLFMLKLRRGGYQLQDDGEDQPLNKKYDAFVVYNEHDGEWVMQELIPNLENGDPPNFKLCIHERDFMPGNDIFENILDSIENSNKTLLILSPHFAQSEWCYFEMRMAQSQLFEEKKDILLMVMLQDIPDDVMPRVLRKILMTKTYLEWPENELGKRLFWQKLKVAIQSENRVNRITNM
ncbi:toll-like receptor 4 [Ptychodera flava]|uniref:toll-like receptor 4 n=1 Tax=Ptychodera flava TaxID=63121 RepID=UPI00396A360E